MALKWQTVTAEHVNAAIREVAGMNSANRTAGLVVHDNGRTLAAKEVLRVAYRLANRLPSDAPLKFSSGDGTLNILLSLGFKAERLGK
jgi:hypothetical protein